MNADQRQARATDHLQRLTAADGPPEPRVVHLEAHVDWYEDLLRTLSQHRFHILGRSTDLIVFFNQAGRVIGWRDDGREGAEKPAWVDRTAVRDAIVQELDLPKETRLGSLKPRELPPVGWTHQAVLFLAPVPRPDQVLRVWASPKDLRVIQCLYGPVPQGGQP